MSLRVNSQGRIMLPEVGLSSNQPLDSTGSYQPVYNTLDWEGSFNINPEDRSLAVATPTSDDISAMPDRFLELWYRFQAVNIDQQFGDKCLFMAYFLRKVMVLHGFRAHVRQVISEYRHPGRKWAMITGGSQAAAQGLRTHAVVVSGSWILDYAQWPLYQNFGAMAPKAIVARSVFDRWQDLGFFGQVRYSVKPHDHEETLNQRILQRDAVNQLTRSYFAAYRAR